MEFKTFACILGFLFCLCGQVHAVAKCKKPNGVDGDVRLEGCLKFTCTAVNKKKGQWVESPSM